MTTGSGARLRMMAPCIFPSPRRGPSVGRRRKRGKAAAAHAQDSPARDQTSANGSLARRHRWSLQDRLSTLFVLTLLVATPVSCTSSGDSRTPSAPSLSPSAQRPQSNHGDAAATTSGAAGRNHEAEFQRLIEVTDDKSGLEAIRTLHQQLDDDNDGTIEPSETKDFVRTDLHFAGDRNRQKLFHRKDSEITVRELWVTWDKSEVHNWTVDKTVDWLVNNVDLPQYGEVFRQHGVTGKHLPSVAVNTGFVSKVLGITNPIHRSKITLKAMDAVLFGPPKDQSSFVKDLVLTSLLVAAVTGLFYAYRQNKKSQEHLKRMMSDMDSLSKAEAALKDMQDKLQQRESAIESLSSAPSDVSIIDAMEVSRLKEEVEVLRNELHRAEVELEDKHWYAPPVLQHWLQLTYEMESLTYNHKKKMAEDQLELAKDMCEKLKRKRSSLVGAFVSTHGRSIDDVDRSILDARTALQDVTRDLQERTQRWRQMEMLCGCGIMTNAGIEELRNRTRLVGFGSARHAAAAATAAAGNATPRPHAIGAMSVGGTSSRMSNSQDDLLDDLDSHSIAASSSHMSTVSSHYSRPSALLSGVGAAAAASPRAKKWIKSKSRESSKESSSSDELERNVVSSPAASAAAAAPIPSPKVSVGSNCSGGGDGGGGAAATPYVPHVAGPPSVASVASTTTIGLPRATTPPAAPAASAPAAKREHMMKKSHSHDAGAAAASGCGVSGSLSSAAMETTLLSNAVSDSQLLVGSRGGGGAGGGGGSGSATPLTQRPPTLQEEESCSASDSGSVNDLDGKKKKKKSTSFFNKFRPKKDKEKTGVM